MPTSHHTWESDIISDLYCQSLFLADDEDLMPAYADRFRPETADSVKAEQCGGQKDRPPNHTQLLVLFSSEEQKTEIKRKAFVFYIHSTICLHRWRLYINTANQILHKAVTSGFYQRQIREDKTLNNNPR